MAKARMLHKKISVSSQVNRLSLPARLLFTWMISHADDEGRLQGEPEYVKATVVPMTKWSFKKVRNYLEAIKIQGLIYYWEENNEWFIEFIKWNEYQQIRKDRFEFSSLPSFNKGVGNLLSTKRQLENNQDTPQSNVSESNLKEVNTGELSGVERKYEGKPEHIADENSYKESLGEGVNPNNFFPMNEVEYAALEAWKETEPDNPGSFNFYLWAARKGLPSSKFFEFASEVKQDNSIRNKGAVFNKKVKDYFTNQRG